MAQFVLGFAALADALGEAVVGEPLEDERHNPDNGDGLQGTSRGLMAWRKEDNVTAFTNGERTWLAGPLGLQERGNEEWFDWELGEPDVADVRSALPVAPWNAHPIRAVSRIELIVVHWDGGPVALPDRYDPVAYYRTEALYHIAKDWGGGSRGYGLSYHEKVSRGGRIWLTRSATDVVWACSEANTISYNLCLDANEKTGPTVEQLRRLPTRLDALVRRYGLSRGAVRGHGELTQYGNATACPGPRLLSLIREYRGHD